jgi:hypothetical protein
MSIIQNQEPHVKGGNIMDVSQSKSSHLRIRRSLTGSNPYSPHSLSASGAGGTLNTCDRP